MSENTSTWLRPGMKVAVINRTMSGKFFVEGCATVRHVLDEDQAEVYFEGCEETDTFDRFVDRAAQQNPVAFCDEMNRLTGVDKKDNSPIDDSTAMNRIHTLLDGREWSVGMLDKIAEIVRSTGREVRDVLEDDDA